MRLQSYIGECDLLNWKTMLTRREWTKIVASIGLASCSQPEKSNLTDEHTSLLSSKDILDRSIVLDLHCDTPTRLVEEKLDLSELHTTGELDIPRMRQGGVTGVFFSIYTGATNKTPLEAVKKALEIIGRLFVCHRAVQIPEVSVKQHAGDKPPPRRQTAHGGVRRKCTVNSHSMARIRAGYIFFQLPLFSKACAAWMTLASS